MRFEPALAAPFAVEEGVTIAPADPGGKECEGPPLLPEADPAITVGEGSTVSTAAGRRTKRS